MPFARVLLPCVVVAAAVASADARAAASQRRLSTDYTCAADLGPGVGNASRRFCDVMITTTPERSVAVPIPPRTGPATLLFDLHNRFTVIGAAAEPGAAYVRHTAIVALITPEGTVLARTGVRREFRSIQDLFDRIAGGGGRGGVKLVAPGQPHAVRAAIPSGVPSIGIVGERLEVMSRDGVAVHELPDRPIALVSNVRVEYTAK
jgi:hypothetical protein